MYHQSSCIGERKRKLDGDGSSSDSSRAVRRRPSKALDLGKQQGNEPREGVLRGRCCERCQSQCHEEPPDAALQDTENMDVENGRILAQMEQQVLEGNPVPALERALNNAFLMLCDGSNDINRYFSGLRVLKSVLFFVEKNHDFVSETAVVGVILPIMDRFMSSVRVQIEAIKVLQQYVKPHHCSNAKGSIAHNAIILFKRFSTIFRSMQRHLDNVTIQCMGLDLARRLKNSQQQHANMQTVWTAGTKSIMKAIQRYPAVSSIQQIGLSLIAWLTEDAGCRQVVINEGGIECIPLAMKLHPEDGFLQCNAAASLCWLVHAGGARGRLQIGSSHISTILASMAYHIENPSTFGNCVCLLSGLTDVVNVQQAFKIITMGMRRHVKSAKVQEGCLHFIRFRDPTTCYRELIDSIPLILESMRTHPNDAHLQAQACDVLAVLSSSPPPPPSAEVKSTVKGNRNNDSSGQIEHGGHSLRRSKDGRRDSINSEPPPASLREHLSRTGTVDMVFATLRRYGRDNRDVERAALWFLTLMVPDDAAAATSAFGGGVGAIESIWRSLDVTGPGGAAELRDDVVAVADDTQV